MGNNTNISFRNGAVAADNAKWDVQAPRNTTQTIGTAYLKKAVILEDILRRSCCNITLMTLAVNADVSAAQKV